MLKSQILSGRWGSVPGPGLVFVTIGGHEYLAPKWVGLAYLLLGIGIVAVGVIFVVKSAFRKKY